MKTGKIVGELDKLCDKRYLLLFARGVGAPLFRAAILQQVTSPPDRNSVGGGANNHPTSVGATPTEMFDDMMQILGAMFGINH